QGQVRCPLPVGRALPFEPRDRLAPQRLPELEEQPRLADARLAHQAHDLTMPRFRSFPTRGEEAQFLLPARQRGEAALDADLEAAPPPAPPRDVEDAYRLPAPLPLP